MGQIWESIRRICMKGYIVCRRDDWWHLLRHPVTQNMGVFLLDLIDVKRNNRWLVEFMHDWLTPDVSPSTGVEVADGGMFGFAGTHGVSQEVLPSSLLILLSTSAFMVFRRNRQGNNQTGLSTQTYCMTFEAGIIPLFDYAENTFCVFSPQVSESVCVVCVLDAVISHVGLVYTH